jgi:probable O-glycosylation ligase (exosortase A-associated)
VHDLAFVGFLGLFFALGFRRPFLFVLCYVYIDLVSPQRLTYLLLNSVPISMIAAVFVVGGWIIGDDKRDVRVAPRQIMILALLAYCGFTTMHADFPIDAGEKWAWVWKTLAFAAFLPLTLRTRLRIEALLTFMILSAAAIIIVGGVKTLAGGGGYGELNLIVDSNSGLYEGSTISTVAIAIIPAILWVSRFGTIFKRDWKVKGFCYALAFSCLLIPVGTSTRTGLMCIGLLGVLMLRDSKHKVAFAAVIAVMALAAIPFLPKTFTERMGTIQTYKADESASTRVAVWAWTREYVQDHPLGGGFEMYRQNQIRYELQTLDKFGNPNGTKLTIDRARAYHSSYFEMLGEQGYPGLALWLLIGIAGIFRMEVLRYRYRDAPEDLKWVAPLAAALENGQLLYMLGSCFIAIAFQSFIFMLIGMQIGLDTYLARLRSQDAFRPMGRAKPDPDQEPALA